jgi:hypothetical protein
MMYRVYYSNGVTYDSSADNRPAARDVQVIVQDHDIVGKHTQSGYDVYCWRSEQRRWVGMDDMGLFDYLLAQDWYRHDAGRHYLLLAGEWTLMKDKFHLYKELMNTGQVLFGRTLTTPEFNAVMTQAVKDMGEAKTGWLRDERRPD